MQMLMLVLCSREVGNVGIGGERLSSSQSSEVNKD
jgi:hypothetical protein